MKCRRTSTLLFLLPDDITYHMISCLRSPVYKRQKKTYCTEKCSPTYEEGYSSVLKNKTEPMTHLVDTSHSGRG